MYARGFAVIQEIYFLNSKFYELTSLTVTCCKGDSTFTSWRISITCHPSNVCSETTNVNLHLKKHTWKIQERRYPFKLNCFGMWKYILKNCVCNTTVKRRTFGNSTKHSENCLVTYRNTLSNKTNTSRFTDALTNLYKSKQTKPTL